MMNVLYVALGSALGGVCRYFISAVLGSVSGFPWATLCVNVSGSLAIGLLSGWLAHGADNAAVIRAFAVVGFCGGFTTFSTFSNESFRMLENSQWWLFAVYAISSLSVGMAAVWIGYSLSR